jgi:hypothetical protein
MATNKIAFATSTAITITLNSLADAAARQSASVDNTTNLYLDALITVQATLAAGSPTGDKAIYIYAYGSEDGTNFTDNASGSDAAITLRVPTNLYLLGTIQTPDSGGLLYKSHPLSVARAFNNKMPRKWGIAVLAKAGVALAGSGNSASYTGITTTTV